MSFALLPSTRQLREVEELRQQNEGRWVALQLCRSRELPLPKLRAKKVNFLSTLDSGCEDRTPSVSSGHTVAEGQIPSADHSKMELPLVIAVATASRIPS